MYWVTHFQLIDPYLSDSAVQLFGICALLAAVRKNVLWFVLSLAVGAFFKESILIFAVVGVVMFARTTKVGLRSSLLGTLPAIAVIIAIRIWIPALNGDPEYIASLPEVMGENPYVGLKQTVIDAFQYRARVGTWEAMPIALTVNAFGGLILFAGLSGVWMLRKSQPEWLVFYVVAILQIIVARNTERVVAVSTPALLAGVGYVLGRLPKDAVPRTLIVATAVASVFLCLFTDGMGKRDLAWAMFVIGLFMVIVYRKKRRNALQTVNGSSNTRWG